MKKLFFMLIIGFCIFTEAFSESYQIVNVDYKIYGMTRESVIKTQVPVDKKRIFENEDDLINYINDYKVQLENTRCFEKIDTDFTVSIPDENGLAFVDLYVEVKDAFHILGVPYPKFSASGDNGYLVNLKVKIKDNNFLGSMKEMGADVNLEVDTNKDPIAFKLGSTFSFDTPFSIGPVNANWANNYTLSYTFGQNTPEWNLKTGIEFSLPFNKFSINLNVYQSFIRNLEYDSKNVNGSVVHYGDGTYFVEDVTFSIPIIIQDVDNWGKIYYTPYAHFLFNWDFDGISPENTDLLGPTITIAQSITTKRINWQGNFRNGISVSFKQPFKYNFYTKTMVPGFDFTLMAYKAFKYVGLCTYMEGFAYLNGSEKIGDRLRGIRDEQYFATTTGYGMNYACETPGAIILNFDLPIHIFTAYWDQMSFFKKIPHIGIFNMELQLSPFVDIALIHNVATNTSFNFRDGFYAAGIEALIFPLKWKGFQLRASVGIDLGRKMPVLKDKVNQDWRSPNVSASEITIGLGFHY